MCFKIKYFCVVLLSVCVEINSRHISIGQDKLDQLNSNLKTAVENVIETAGKAKTQSSIDNTASLEINQASNGNGQDQTDSPVDVNAGSVSTLSLGGVNDGKKLSQQSLIKETLGNALDGQVSNAVNEITKSGVGSTKVSHGPSEPKEFKRSSNSANFPNSEKTIDPNTDNTLGNKNSLPVDVNSITVDVSKTAVDVNTKEQPNALKIVSERSTESTQQSQEPQLTTTISTTAATASTATTTTTTTSTTTKQTAQAALCRLLQRQGMPISKACKAHGSIRIWT